MKKPRSLSYGIRKYRAILRYGKEISEQSYILRKSRLAEEKEEARKLKRLEKNDLFV
jgi:hypothetical protein